VGNRQKKPIFDSAKACHSKADRAIYLYQTRTKKEEITMAYEAKTRIDLPHNVILEGRERLSISGVEDVESFNEETIVVYTSKGMLLVQGNDLHIEKLSLDGGDLAVEGKVHTLRYEEETQERGGLLSRLFK